MLNVTATNATGPGFVTLWPSDQPQPLASALNLERVGQTIPNFAIVPVSPEGKVSFFSSRATDLVADVLGYFTDATAPLRRRGPVRPP